MHTETYLQGIKNIKKTIYGTSYDKIQNLGSLGFYSLLSANLLKYLHLKAELHFKMVQDIQFHRAVSGLDQHYPDLAHELKITGNTELLKSNGGKGNIFVTFHTGSFRLFNALLNNNRIPFCLVTEGIYIKEQGALVQKLFKEGNGEDKDLEILEAENPRLLLELIRRINSGISVVFYIDGNTGVKEKKLSENKNLLKINFLQSEIYARQGIAMLAYLSKAQIVLALAKRNRDLTNTLKLKEIKTKTYEKLSRTEFVNNVTKSLFGELAHFLSKYPEQWEGWFYIQKFFEQNVSENVSISENIPGIKKDEQENQITVGIDPFVQLLKYDEENIFVIKKRDYQIMEVTPMLYEVLDYFRSPKKIVTNNKIIVNNFTIEWEFVEELIEMNLLSA